MASMVRLLMIVGINESVFAQYLLAGAKTWIGPKGHHCPLLPKSEGGGYIMLLAFCLTRVAK